MTRRPPHPEPLRGSALSHEGRGEDGSISLSHEGRGEGKAPSKRQIELLTRIKKKRIQFPSPLVGEGGVRSTPGEGALPATEFARKLREKLTDAERRLWHALKDRRFAHLKFRRQVPMGQYIADFLSHEAKLVIEVDGSQHVECADDRIRDDWFRGEGYQVLRFWNHDVLGKPDSVLDTIAAKIGTVP
jgi:very-short-patch-repair endonuclease